MIIAPRSKTKIGVLVFDGVSSDEHELTVTTTDQTISSGQRVTDHAIVDPRPLTMEVIATRSKGSATPTSPDDFNPIRHQQLYDQLIELAKLRLLVTITTSVDTYASMLITRVSYSRASMTDTNRKRIRVEAREILTGELIPIDALAPGLVDAAGSVDDLGAVGFESIGEVAAP